MAKQPLSLININGVVVDARNVQLPADRSLRNAWELEGDVVTIDMDKAKGIRRDQLIREADEMAKSAEMEAKRKLFDGQDSAAADLKVARLRGNPKREGISMISNAAEPTDLDRVSVDDIF